jgi:hypothetical protein
MSVLVDIELTSKRELSECVIYDFLINLHEEHSLLNGVCDILSNIVMENIGLINLIGQVFNKTGWCFD